MINPVTRKNRQSLTHPIKCAVTVLIDEGQLTRKGHFWYSVKGSRVAYQTIEAMYARYLIRIVTESRHRNKQFARLTEVGEVLARGLKAGIMAPPAHPIVGRGFGPARDAEQRPEGIMMA